MTLLCFPLFPTQIVPFLDRLPFEYFLWNLNVGVSNEFVNAEATLVVDLQVDLMDSRWKETVLGIQIQNARRARVSWNI